ncbi:MAG: MmcQ/YjbR family DNA-binding protein [Candidatus Acidiferrales bacterium]
MISEVEILKKLRKVCLALPDAEETVSFGHPTFRVHGGRIFTVLETYKGELGICINVGKLLQGIFLDDPRFFRTPYIGKHGWVTLRVYAAPLNWKEIRDLVRGSYLLVAPRSSKKTRRNSPKARSRKKQ